MAGFDEEDPNRPRPPVDDDVNVDRGPHRFLGIPYALLLVLLTIVGGALRFTNLDQPAIWGDEAATWRRVCGTYPQMISELRTAGFMPAHYLLTWWVKEGFPVAGKFVEPSAEDAPQFRDEWGAFDRPANRRGGMGGPRDNGPALQPGVVATRWAFVPTVRLVKDGIPLTPFVIRFIPALCGTLMVPAIYFLASQLVARRTALLAALFTCCSAYALGYSRDAKMYAQFWLFVTLHVGCLFWWLSAYRRRSVQPADAPARRGLFPKQAELGVGVAGVLPGQHVGHIARAFIVDAELRDPSLAAPLPPPIVLPPPTRLATLVRWACWVTAGLAMIAFNALGLAVVGLEVIFFLVTAPQRARFIARLAVAIASPFLYFIDLARARSVYRGTSYRYASDDAGLVERGAPASPSTRFRARLRDLRLPPVIGFVLGCWAIVALWSSYKDVTRFYDRVVPDATDSSLKIDVNDAGIMWVEPYNRDRTAASMFLYNASAYLLNWEWVKPENADELDPEALRALTHTTSVLLITIVAGLVPWRQAIGRLRPNRVKRERTIRERGPMPATSFLALAIWILVPTYGLYVACGAWHAYRHDEFEKVRAVTPLQGLISIVDRPVEQSRYRDVLPAGALGGSGVIAEQVRAAWAGEEAWGQAWTTIRALHWSELFHVSYAPPEPDGGRSRLPWVLVGLVIGVGAYAMTRRATSMRWLLLAGRAAVAIVALGGVLCVVYAAVPMQDKSIWMPRYAGFVWPAFAIIVCVLIRRLPFPPVRWAVVVLLVGANLTQFFMRCKHGEPPTAQLAATARADFEKPDAKLFVSMVPKMFMGAPGSGTFYTMPFVYYWALQGHLPMTPDEVQGLRRADFGQLQFDGNTLANGIRGTLARSPLVSHFDVWAELRQTTAAEEPAHGIGQRLGAGWRLAGPVERQTIYDHWTWRRMYVLEHERWERVATASTATATPTPKPASPTAKPASRPPAITITPSRPATRPTSSPATARAPATRPR